jgi:hypothetical protein
MAAIVLRSPRYVEEHALRPGTVTEILGVVFQSDGRSTIGRIFIRPFEALDRWAARILPRPGERPLAMHSGIHVVIDGKEYVAEQLVGSFYMDFRNGLNWTPYETFRERDRGGWDVTVQPDAFRAFDDASVKETLDRLNAIEGHPFIGEDCTAFVERAFGCRRFFADSPLMRRLGLHVRVGDPALPLLRRDALLPEDARGYLQFDKIKNLPDAEAAVESPNLRLRAHRVWPVALLAPPRPAVRAYSSSSRRSTPVSRTARKFLR